MECMIASDLRDHHNIERILPITIAFQRDVSPVPSAIFNPSHFEVSLSIKCFSGKVRILSYYNQTSLPLIYFLTLSEFSLQPHFKTIHDDATIV